MLNRRVILLFILVGSFWAACGSSNTHGKNDGDSSEREVKTMDFVHIGQGSSDWGPAGEYFGPQFLIFTSMQSWMAKKDLFFLNTASLEDEDTDEVEDIDFSSQRVLVFTYGQVGTTGYAILLDKIEVNDTVSFYLTGTEPAEGDAVGEAMDHPIDVVLINVTELPEQMEFYINGVKTEFQIHRE
jgi:hypothetical protein